jgi:hypothetical protein
MHKDFQALPWTYPDYAAEEYSAILRQIRKIFQEKSKQDDKKERY